jgi:hypothetical protein
MIMARVQKLIRRHFPNTHSLVRGDGHFSTPELMRLCDAMPHTDFLFGLAGNPILHRLAEPVMQRARVLSATRQALGEAASVKLYDEFDYAAGSWHKPWRVVLKAEVMALCDNPRFVVTSMHLPEPQTVYADLYCARGQAENFIKQVKCDLAADRTSCTTFLNHLLGQLHAADSALCGLCPAPTTAGACAQPHRTGRSATQYRHPQTVQSRHPDQTIQRPHRLALAVGLSIQTLALDTHRTIVSGQTSCYPLFLIAARLSSLP